MHGDSCLRECHAVSEVDKETSVEARLGRLDGRTFAVAQVSSRGVSAGPMTHVNARARYRFESAAQRSATKEECEWRRQNAGTG